MENKRDNDMGAMEFAGETLGGVAGRVAGRATDAALDVATSQQKIVIPAKAGI